MCLTRPYDLPRPNFTPGPVSGGQVTEPDFAEVSRFRHSSDIWGSLKREPQLQVLPVGLVLILAEWVALLYNVYIGFSLGITCFFEFSQIYLSIG